MSGTILDPIIQRLFGMLRTLRQGSFMSTGLTMLEDYLRINMLRSLRSYPRARIF